MKEHILIELYPFYQVESSVCYFSARYGLCLKRRSEQRLTSLDQEIKSLPTYRNLCHIFIEEKNLYADFQLGNNVNK